VGERAPQFQGYSQHDAQEFCAYILDLLHEDVNQVKKKPYVEQKEAEGRDDALVADESWEGFKSRNQSRIVDLFYGQYKSTLDCPKCKRKSVTFDPYVYLSLPMPSETRKLRILFFYSPTQLKRETAFALERQRPRKLEITVSKSGGTVAEIGQQVARLTGCKPENLCIFKEYKHMIRQVVHNKDGLEDIEGTDSVIVCEVEEDEEIYKRIGINFRKDLREESLVEPTDCKTCGVREGDVREGDAEGKPVSLVRCQKCRSVWYCSKACQRENWNYHKPNCSEKTEGVGVPLFVALPKICTRGELRAILLRASKHTIKYEWSENAAADQEHEEFKCMPASQIGVTQQKHYEIEKEWTDEQIDLTDVEYLTVTWLNDRYKNRHKPEVPYIASVASVPNDELACDNVGSNGCGTDDNVVTLDRCIEMFSESEVLEKSEYWYCSKCKDHVAAQKQLQLWRLPRILVFHIKRFQYRASQYFAHSVRRDKINKYVDYDVNGLDMSPYCMDPSAACDGGAEPVYDLIGVVNHMGSMSYGHYTAAIRHPDQPDVWRKADDSRVNNIDEKQAKSEYAYLLFYKLREGDESSGVAAVDPEQAIDEITQRVSSMDTVDDDQTSMEEENNVSAF